MLIKPRRTRRVTRSIARKPSASLYKGNGCRCSFCLNERLKDTTKFITPKTKTTLDLYKTPKEYLEYLRDWCRDHQSLCPKAKWGGLFRKLDQYDVMENLLEQYQNGERQ